jgi:hypothetical protein
MEPSARCLRTRCSSEVRAQPSGAHRTPSEAAPAEAHCRVDRCGPQTAIGRSTLKEADVCRHPGQTREVHRDTLKLEHYTTRSLDAELDIHICQGLNRCTVGPRVRDACIPGDGLDQRCKPSRIAAKEKALNTPVLITEVNLKMMNSLAKAHEAKASGLDYPRVNGTDGDLVDFFAVDPVKWVGVALGTSRHFEANGFQPGVPGDSDGVLLVQLALEAMKRRKVRS